MPFEQKGFGANMICLKDISIQKYCNNIFCNVGTAQPDIHSLQ